MQLHEKCVTQAESSRFTELTSNGNNRVRLGLLAYQKDKSDSYDFVPGKMTAKAALLKGLLDGRNEVLRNVGASCLVLELKKSKQIQVISQALAAVRF